MTKIDHDPDSDIDQASGLPIGAPVHRTTARPPERVALTGRYVTVAPLDAAAHGDALWEATRGAENDRLWRYLAYGPFADRAEFDAHLARMASTADPLAFAIVDRESGRAIGIATYLRIEPAQGSIEVGHILYSPALQRSRGATEAMYLMARHVFEDLGYRRYEWKCDALNARSRRAAARLGFTFEGVFRQHMIVKGRNRDTAWFSMLDGEWPARKAAFERWLDPANFDADGRRRLSLAALNGVETESSAG
jgi:RimJ/RimL family protein N-acetyltransferase